MPAATVPSVREKHKADVRQVILNTAREIFVGEGYERFSMRKLAARCECSTGGVYLHFKNKEDLFGALVDASFARLDEAQLRLDEELKLADPVEALKRGLRMYVEFGLSNPNDYRFAFLLGSPAQNRSAKPRPAFERLRGRVTRCVRQERFLAVDIETASQALWCAVHGVTSLLIERPSFAWVERDKLISRVIDSAVDSLSAPGDGRNEEGTR